MRIGRRLVELSRVVARHGGFYASHIRDEAAGLLNSIDEAIAIGREAGLPVHISHLKATGKANWGLVRTACDRIREARNAGQTVTADQYPYIASSTSLAAFVVPDWAHDRGRPTTSPGSPPTRSRGRSSDGRDSQKELSERDGGGTGPDRPLSDRSRARVGKDTW